MDVGLLIGWSPFVREALKRRFGIPVPQLRTSVAACGSLGKDVDWSIEPDGYGAFVQELACSRVHVGAAAGGNDAHLSLDKPRDETTLAVSKIMFPIALEDFGGRKSGCVLDRCVTIDKRQPEPPRETPPDGRFSDPHQPDQHNWAVEALP